MTMQALSRGVETALRALLKRGGPTRRYCDLADVDRRHLAKAVELGLAETLEGRNRKRARLTPAGLYYARLVALMPPALQTLRAITPPAAAQGDIERWIAGRAAAE